MIRNVMSVIAGFALWSALHLIGNAVAASAFPNEFGADGSLWHPGILSAFVLAAAVQSFLAGALTARIAGAPTRGITALAVLLMTIGVLVEVANWNLLPVWYHLAFLAVLVPPLFVGARRSARRRTTKLGDTHPTAKPLESLT